MKARFAFLLLMGLAFVAAAQPTRPGAAVVDSREECAAVEGSWKATGNTGQSACEVPWSREDCLRLGASWTQVAKAATGGRCVARISEAGLAQQCRERGGVWSPPGSRAPQCSFETTAKAPTPASRAPDAGKLCDSQQDCTYGCVYQGPPVAPKADVMGHCRASSLASGCYSMVESGRLAGSVCIK